MAKISLSLLRTAGSNPDIQAEDRFFPLSAELSRCLLTFLLPLLLVSTSLVPPSTPVINFLTKDDSKTPLARQAFVASQADGGFRQISVLARQTP
ncbi:MAG: hypothetical protein VXZ82_16760 [Planctomycetota bacterium]|nr:hypothetical protein [Planctomycetota bacterium]